jgi:AcrR family transcriptional regulator
VGRSSEKPDLGKRDRIRAAIVALAAERGYRATSIEHVMKRAGVDRVTFDHHFESLEECFSAAWDELDTDLRRSMEEAFASRDDWQDRLREALTTGMRFLAADEVRARFYISEVLVVDDRMRDRQNRAMDRLSLAIDLGRENPGSDQPPLGVAEAISGAIWHRVHQLVQAGRTADLPDQVPRFMYLAVLPYRGADAAQAELDGA